MLLSFVLRCGLFFSVFYGDSPSTKYETTGLHGSGLYCPQGMGNDVLFWTLGFTHHDDTLNGSLFIEKILCMGVALLLQIYILVYLYMNESGIDEFSHKMVFSKWQYYWNNPLLFISLCSVKKVFEHMLIIFIPRFIRLIKPYRVLGIALATTSLILLMAVYDSHYCIVIPCLIASWGNLRTSSKSNMRNRILQSSKIAMSIIVMMYIYFAYEFQERRALYDAEGDKSNFFIRDLNGLSKNRASMGVIWYLAALLIDYVKDYFSFLLSILPLILAIGLTARFFYFQSDDRENIREMKKDEQDKDKGKEKQIGTEKDKTPFMENKVSTSSPFSLSFGKARKNAHHLEVFHAIVVIIHLMKYDLSLIDIGFCVSLLFMRHESIVLKMRYLPIIGIGLVITCVLSPLMHHMWVQQGNGNANFLFFQGMALWIVAAFGIIEFIRAALRYNEKEE